MNEKNDLSINDIVAGYEAMTETGSMSFLDEAICNRLIEYYEQDEQIDRALEVAEYAIHHFPFSIDFYLKRVHLLLSDDQADEALKCLDDAAVYSPFDPEIALLRAEIHIYNGWIEDALALLDELKDDAGSELLSDIYFLESLAFEQQAMYERMYFSLRASLSENPGNQEALEKIWNSIDACKRHDEGEKLFEEILEKDGYCSLAWYNLGHIKAYQGNYREAIDCYEYAYLTNEKFDQAYRDCAELCFEMKQYHRALGCYVELMEKFETDAEVIKQIGRCHQQLNNTKIARTFFAQALNYDPFDDEVLFYIGECFAADENWTRAIHYFQKAVSIEDSREEFFGALANAFHRIGDFEQARVNFEKAIEAAPEENLYWTRYALFLTETGNGAEAIDVLDEAEENTVGAELVYCRIACLFFTGCRQEGLYWLGEALEEEYEAHRLLFSFNPALESDPDIISMISTYTI